MARLLGVRHDINSAALETVRSCALLVFPKSISGVVPFSGKVYADENIEVVTVYHGTREVFRELLLNSTQGSECEPTLLIANHHLYIKSKLAFIPYTPKKQTSLAYEAIHNRRYQIPQS